MDVGPVYFCWLQSLVFLKLASVSAFFNTSLIPVSDIYICPEAKASFICNETGVSFLIWNWRNSSTSFEITSYILDSRAINSINVTKSIQNIGVSVTLLELGLSGMLYIASSLTITPVIGITDINISCNRQQRSVKIEDCSSNRPNVSIDPSITMNDGNRTTILLSWNHNEYSNFRYEINVSKNLENILNIATNDTSIEIELDTEIEHFISLFAYCCQTVKNIQNFNITILQNNSIIINGDATHHGQAKKGVSEEQIILTTSLENTITSDRKYHPCENLRNEQTIIISTGAALLSVSFILNVALLITIVAMKISITSSTTNNEDIHSAPTTTSDQVTVQDYEIPAIVPNAAYEVHNLTKYKMSQ